jgi:hypothetical protein
MSLDEARDAVVRDLESARRKQAIDRLYETLAERYTVTVESLEPELQGP